MRAKKLKKWLTAAALTGSLFTGQFCDSSIRTCIRAYAGEDMTEMTVNNGLDEMNETEKKKIFELLTDTFPGDDRVISGEYSDRMLEVIGQYIAVKQKIEEKYPSYDLEIIRCEPKSLLGPAYNIFFVKQADMVDDISDAEGSAVYVYEKQENNGADNEKDNGQDSIDGNREDNTSVYEIKDAFMGSIMQPRYESLLLQKLRENVPECYQVNTLMTDVYGDDYDENVTPEEVMDGRRPMWNRTIIRADGSGKDVDLLLTSIRKYLEENTFCGSYQLLVTEGSAETAPVAARDSLILPLPQPAQNF